MPFEWPVAIREAICSQLALWHSILKHLNPAAHQACGNRLFFPWKLWRILDEPYVPRLEDSDNALLGK